MKSSIRPVLFSRRFGISESDMDRLGVFDPTLNADSLLFPDPLLLENSQHDEMSAARTTFDKYFERVMKILHKVTEKDDVIRKAAFRLLSFPEIKGTCLGYGSGSIAGSGSGPEMTRRLLDTGKKIVDMGIDDPDLFMAMGLFEEDFGPDLIGDMLTNVAFGEIADFNARIIEALKLPARSFQIRLKNGTKYNREFVENPVIGDGQIPIILMPKDILRDLPVATNWAEVQDVAAQNDEFRDSLNDAVAELWSKKTLESKERLKTWALSGPEAFGNLLDMLHGHDGKPYDFVSDPNGELIWRGIGERIVADHPIKISKPKAYDADEVIAVVEKIIAQFTFLIEKRDLWKELYTDGTFTKPRFEKSAQRLFYVSFYSYCEANDLDITPEAETGRGPVDFKVSSGMEKRVLVEVKLSTNTHLVSGYEKQLEIYNEAEKPISSYYVVINVGSLAKKWKAVSGLRERRLEALGIAPELILIDGLPKASASKTI